MSENTPKHKIEDMTLGQIKGLKEEIADELRGYLKGITEIVTQKFDVGAIDFSVNTHIPCFEAESGDKWVSPNAHFNIKINFGKEI